MVIHFCDIITNYSLVWGEVNKTTKLLVNDILPVKSGRQESLSIFTFNMSAIFIFFKDLFC